VFNQLDRVYSIAELADKIARVAKKLGIDAKIKKYTKSKGRRGRTFLQGRPRTS